MPADDDFELSEEDWGVIYSVVKPKKMSVAEALETDDRLFHISNNIKQRTKEQKLFTLLYAAILEVCASGVPALFERFNKTEIKKIYQHYHRLGATKFCVAMDELTDFFYNKSGASFSKNDISNLINNDEFDEIDRKLTSKSKMLCKEMERKLLSFVKQNITKLED